MLPYISVVAERTAHLTAVLAPIGIIVRGYCGDADTVAPLGHKYAVFCALSLPMSTGQEGFCIEAKACRHLGLTQIDFLSSVHGLPAKLQLTLPTAPHVAASAAALTLVLTCRRGEHVAVCTMEKANVALNRWLKPLVMRTCHYEGIQ